MTQGPRSPRLPGLKLQQPLFISPSLSSFHRRDTQLAVQKYEELFPAFSDSRECKLMKVSVGAPFPALSTWAWRWVAASQGGDPGHLDPVSVIAEVCVVVLKGLLFLFCFPSSAI